ncbi:MAG: iron-only hydrogenase system regulator [Abditibacteriota bacterium]|nr:iron-only hydrogenase system regulator [Abditibacteriota bacterium]
METRVAVISVILDCGDAAPLLNGLLHEYRDWIIGRMGIPYKAKGVCIVSVALDAPQDVIAALSGKIGKIEGASVKTSYSSLVTKEDM